MELKRICLLYFSPTGGTRRVGRIVAGELARRLGLEVVETDFTRPAARTEEYRFGREDLLVMASPVYAGRLPNKLLPDYRERILGDGTPAVPICVFGNRSPDEALRELVLLLEGNGFRIAGAAAFAGRHAFSDRIGAGRPDGEDLARDRALLHAPAGGRGSGQIPEGKAEDPLGPVRPVRPVRPGLPPGQHRRGEHGGHGAVRQVPGLRAPVPQGGEVFRRPGLPLPCGHAGGALHPPGGQYDADVAPAAAAAAPGGGRGTKTNWR